MTERDKRQYRVPVASDYRGRDSSLLSMRSLEDRRQRPTLLLYINRRKVEAFIHSVISFHWPLCLVPPIVDDFCRIRINSDVLFERAYCWPRKGPKQDLWCIRCTGALLMYAAVAIIPAASSFSQTRPIFLASDHT